MLKNLLYCIAGIAIATNSMDYTDDFSFNSTPTMPTVDYTSQLPSNLDSYSTSTVGFSGSENGSSSLSDSDELDLGGSGLTSFDNSDLTLGSDITFTPVQNKTVKFQSGSYGFDSGNGVQSVVLPSVQTDVTGSFGTGNGSGQVNYGPSTGVVFPQIQGTVTSVNAPTV